MTISVHKNLTHWMDAFSRSEKRSILLAALAGTVIRCYLAYGRSLLGDEANTFLLAHQSATHILTNFYPSLTMNYYILFCKLWLFLFGDNPSLLQIPSLIAGVACIPLVSLVAVRYTNSKAATLCAWLTSFQPYLVLYSCTARSYAIFLAFSLLTVLLFLDYLRDRNARKGLYFTVVCFYFLLSHAYAVYTIAFLGLEVVLAGGGVKQILRGFALLLIPCVFGLWAYVPFLSEMLHDGAKWRSGISCDLGYLVPVYRIWFGGNVTSWALAGVLAISLVLAPLLKPKVMVLWAWILAPVVGFAISGFSNIPIALARYMICGIPPMLILAADSICVATYKLGDAKGRLMAGFVALLLIWSWRPAMEHNLGVKKRERWQDVAQYVTKRYSPREAVILSVGSSYSHRNMWPYLFGTGFETIHWSGLLAYLDDHAAGLESQTLILVNESSYAVPSKDSRCISFGRLNVTTYTNVLDRASLKTLREDLLAATGERIDPCLDSVYWVILDLTQYLGMNDTGDRLHALGEECHRQQVAVFTPEFRVTVPFRGKVPPR